MAKSIVKKKSKKSKKPNVTKVAKATKAQKRKAKLKEYSSCLLELHKLQGVLLAQLEKELRYL